ncbi:unnamed protein product [Calypogeia fissa]
MDDKEFELYEIDANGENKSFLSEITMPSGNTGLWFSDIRSYIHQMDLLDCSFDFWNEGCHGRIDQKFEKALKVKGSEVIVLRSDVLLGKRTRVDDESGPNIVEMVSRQSVNVSGRPDEPCDTDDVGAIQNDRANDIVEIRVPLPNVDRSVPLEEGGPQRLRSKLMFDDLIECWSRAVRSTKHKMEQKGKEDHVWWLETWDEGDQAVAKVWCNECKKWNETGKPDQYSNTLSNFFQQHVSTSMHKDSYKARVGRDAREAERERKKQDEINILHRHRITEAIAIIKDANDKNGSECFVIEGDVLNTKLSPGSYKW